MSRSSIHKPVLKMFLTLTLGMGVGLFAAGVPAEAATLFMCDDDSGLCLVDAPDGAKWQPDRKSTGKDRKRRSKKRAGTLSVTIEGGRGSVFLNGRFIGTAPVEGATIPAGKNDVQVRDGSDLLVTGLLTVPRESDVTVVVRHD